MKILFYNWIQFDKKNNQGGGVNVYQKNLIDFLIKNRKEYEIYFLSSGIYYNLFKNNVYIKETKNIYGNKCRTFKMYNSPCIAPAKAMYNNIDTFMNDEETYNELVKFIKKFGEFDVIHFNNIEGVSTKCLEIKKDFPNTKVIYSVHNYCLFCPQINLFYNNKTNCLDYENGKKCVSCIKNKENPKKFKTYYKIDNIAEKLNMDNFSNSLKIWLKKIYEKLKNKTTEGKENEIDVNFSNSCEKFRKTNVERLNKYVDYVLSVSERVREICIQCGVKEEKVFNEYIGTKFAEKAQYKLNHEVNGEIFTISYMGYFEKMKGFDFLIEALEEIPDEMAKKIAFMCYAKVKSNEDELKIKKIEKLSNKLASAQHFNGYTHEQLKNIYSKIDLGIVPVIWEDNLPQVAIEYAANGIPVLCSDLGGAHELSKAPEFVFKAGDKEDFKSKLENILNNKEILKRYFDNMIKLKTMEEHVSNIESYYNNKK